MSIPDCKAMYMPPQIKMPKPCLTSYRAVFCKPQERRGKTSQQALTGDIMPAEQWDECQTGDLLFFGNAPGKVSHVALYLNDGKYIHSSGQVKINSIDARDTDYYAIPLLGISRVVNKIGTPGITAVKRHPWYFEQK